MASKKSRQTRRGITGSSKLHAKTFVFFDRATGTKRFEVSAGADGTLPREQAISLLAMQCVVRGQSPNDFRVMVSVGESLLDSLIPRTQKLIHHCMATVLPVHVTQRQQEVLGGILHNRSNKQIAESLNVAERTVKFHVSALLRKCHVSGRVGLMQKASDMLAAEKVPVLQMAAAVADVVPRAASPDSNSLPPKLLRLTTAERRLAAR